jgi:glucose-6-phosphate isomerase/transaldolase/glucose-6-phosphate isomerase
VFVELVDRMKPDLTIPGKPFSFGTLAQAQAAGDLESLRTHNRHAIRIALGPNPVATVNRIAAGVQPSTKSPRRALKKKPRRIARR